MMRKLLFLMMIPGLCYGQAVTINNNNLPVSSTNPFSITANQPVNAANVPYVSTEGIQPSYAASASFAGTTGVLFAVCGSSTQIVAVRGISITGTAGQIGTLILQVVKTSTAPSAGTAVTRVPLDSSTAAATATVYDYTTAPTAGTAIGSTYQFTQFFPTVSGGNANNQSPRVLTPEPGLRPMILRGTSQCMELYTASAALTSPSLQVSVSWTESATFP